MALNPQQFNGISDARAASAATTLFLASGKAHQLEPYPGAASSMLSRHTTDPDTAHISLGDGPEYFGRYRTRPGWAPGNPPGYRR